MEKNKGTLMYLSSESTTTFITHMGVPISYLFLLAL
jgi:hypothetical protein